MRLGILTGGGDCPGLNAVIRAAVIRTVRGYGGQMIGFEDGWRGVFENRTRDLNDAVLIGGENGLFVAASSPAPGCGGR